MLDATKERRPLAALHNRVIKNALNHRVRVLTKPVYRRRPLPISLLPLHLMAFRLILIDPSSVSARFSIYEDYLKRQSNKQLGLSMKTTKNRSRKLVSAPAIQSKSDTRWTRDSTIILKITSISLSLRVLLIRMSLKYQTMITTSQLGRKRLSRQ